MARKPQRRREFGNVRKTESGRWQARYWGPDGKRHYAPQTFDTKTDATTWLNITQADIERKHWRDPDAGAIKFEEYAATWIDERGLAATTVDLYQRLLRLHILPTFGARNLDEIHPVDVRSWRAERLKATGGASTTVAKGYRLLKAILQTAVDDDLLKNNPCRIKGAGKEEAEERDVAEVEQVYELAEAMGPCWRLMVLLGAFASLRPEELAELRRSDVDLDGGRVVDPACRAGADERPSSRR
jgi:integrase